MAPARISAPGIEFERSRGSARFLIKAEHSYWMIDPHTKLAEVLDRRAGICRPRDQSSGSRRARVL